MKNFIKICLMVSIVPFLFFVVVIILYGIGGGFEKTQVLNEATTMIIPITTPANTANKTIYIRNGNYIIGKDIQEGTYDIKANDIGNVITSDGKLNMICPNEFKNFKFEKNMELKVMGISTNMEVTLIKK